MDINFSEELPDGRVDFTGTLTKEEVDFLLRFSLLHLLQRGLVPATLVATVDKGEVEEVPDRKDMN